MRRVGPWTGSIVCVAVLWQPCWRAVGCMPLPTPRLRPATHRATERPVAATVSRRCASHTPLTPLDKLDKRCRLRSTSLSR